MGRSENELWEAFRATWLRVAAPSGVFEVEPVAGPAMEGTFPLKTPLHVVTARSPGGGRSSAEENDAAHRRLVDLVPPSLILGDAAGLAPDGSWAERSVALYGAGRDYVLELGRAFGQLAVFEWAGEPDGLRVLPCGEGPELRSGWRSRHLPRRPCPMQRAAEHAMTPCHSPSGPQGGDADRAAAEWAARRHLMLRALGCDVCHGAAQPDR